MKKLVFASMLLGLVFVSSESFAHGGRLNSEGCHNNRKTGGYHCHRSTRSYTPKRTKKKKATKAKKATKKALKRRQPKPKKVHNPCMSIEQVVALKSVKTGMDLDKAFGPTNIMCTTKSRYAYAWYVSQKCSPIIAFTDLKGKVISFRKSKRLRYSKSWAVQLFSFSRKYGKGLEPCKHGAPNEKERSSDWPLQPKQKSQELMYGMDNPSRTITAVIGVPR